MIPKALISLSIDNIATPNGLVADGEAFFHNPANAEVCSRHRQIGLISSLQPAFLSTAHLGGFRGAEHHDQDRSADRGASL